MTKVFTPQKIAGLELKNRFLRAGCFEGMAQDGNVTEQLVAHHKQLARSGLALTTVGYCAVSNDGRGFGHEMWMRDALVPQLKVLSDAIHEEGAAASIQLVHCGFFSSPSVTGKRPLGASVKFCTFRMSFAKAMTAQQIEEKITDFARSAKMAKEAGFDAVEVHAGHGYLLSQFLSPWTNRRKDVFGGSLDNRMRFPMAVMKSVREAVGPEFPVLVKMNQVDGVPGGIELEEAKIIAKSFETNGASAIIPSCGFTAKTPFMMLRGHLPIREMSSNQSSLFMKMGLTLFGRFFVPYHRYEPLFLLKGAKEMARAVSIPVIYIGGVLSEAHAAEAMAAGCEFVQVGRATIREPNFVNNLKDSVAGESDCDHCNRCVAAMDAGGVTCVSTTEGLFHEPS